MGISLMPQGRRTLSLPEAGSKMELSDQICSDQQEIVSSTLTRRHRNGTDKDIGGG